MTRKYQRYSKEFKGGDQSLHRDSVYEPQLSLESYRGRVNDRLTMVEVRYSPGLIGIRRVS